MNKLNLLAMATLLVAAMVPAKAAQPDNWGLGMHAGGGEMIGFHGKKDLGPVQFRLRFGLSATFPRDGEATFLGPDTLNTRSLDRIAGFSLRGYLFDMLYASAGLSMNNRRMETNIEKTDEDTDMDMSTHQSVMEAPLLMGVEFRRRKSVSIYLEAGYVFQLDKPGETVKLENTSYTALYKHPSGSPTVGIGATYNFLR